MIIPYCLICLTTERVLVRDHCHKTGFIRGVLCDRCNSYVGIIENTPDWITDTRLAGSIDNVRNWLVQYTDRIHLHLKRKTNYIYYTDKKKRKKNPKLVDIMIATAKIDGLYNS